MLWHELQYDSTSKDVVEGVDGRCDTVNVGGKVGQVIEDGSGSRIPARTEAASATRTERSEDGDVFDRKGEMSMRLVLRERWYSLILIKKEVYLPHAD